MLKIRCRAYVTKGTIMKKSTIFLYILFVFALSISIALPLRLSRSVNQLLGYTFVIDPGHGGKDDGTSYGGVAEDEVNLAISTYLYELCIEEGAFVIITRTGDYDLASLYASNRKREDLAKRVAYINQSQANLFISIHMNAYRNESVKGPMVYVKKNDEESHHLGQEILQVFNQEFKQDKPLHEEEFYLFKKTTIPGVLVECGFLSNTEERKLLTTSSYQKKIAKYLYRGIYDYLQGKKI